MSVRPVVESYLVGGGQIVACEALREFVEKRLGYSVSGTTVSRVMGNLGWERFTIRGKIHFRQPKAPKS